MKCDDGDVFETEEEDRLDEEFNEGIGEFVEDGILLPIEQGCFRIRKSKEEIRKMFLNAEEGMKHDWESDEENQEIDEVMHGKFVCMLEDQNEKITEKELMIRRICDIFSTSSETSSDDNKDCKEEDSCQNRVNDPSKMFQFFQASFTLHKKEGTNEFYIRIAYSPFIGESYTFLLIDPLNRCLSDDGKAMQYLMKKTGSQQAAEAAIYYEIAEYKDMFMEKKRMNIRIRSDNLLAEVFLMLNCIQRLSEL